MTSTAIINQSIGTGGNVGNAVNSTKTALGATTTAFLISAKVTPGAGHGEGVIRLRYTSASHDTSAANAPTHLAQTSRYLDIVLNPSQPGVPIVKDGTLETVTGANVHVWAEVPPLGVAATLEVNLVELP